MTLLRNFVTFFLGAQPAWPKFPRAVAYSAGRGGDDSRDKRYRNEVVEYCPPNGVEIFFQLPEGSMTRSYRIRCHRDRGRSVQSWKAKKKADPASPFSLKRIRFKAYRKPTSQYDTPTLLSSRGAQQLTLEHHLALRPSGVCLAFDMGTPLGVTPSSHGRTVRLHAVTHYFVIGTKAAFLAYPC